MQGNNSVNFRFIRTLADDYVFVGQIETLEWGVGHTADAVPVSQVEAVLVSKRRVVLCRFSDQEAQGLTDRDGKPLDRTQCAKAVLYELAVCLSLGGTWADFYSDEKLPRIADMSHVIGVAIPGLDDNPF